MGFHELEENLIDMMKEQQAKLGFRQEVIRLYYPVSTLNHFFGTDDTPERMEERLQEHSLESGHEGSIKNSRNPA
jgi:hypothetical protein